MKIILKGSVPSKKNSKRLIMRGGKRFLVPSDAHEAWHEEMMWKLKGTKPIVGPVQIDFILFSKDRRSADLSNKWESVADLLVDAGIIKDDNYFVVPRVLMTFGGVDKANPRVEIGIGLSTAMLASV